MKSEEATALLSGARGALRRAFDLAAQHEGPQQQQMIGAIRSMMVLGAMGFKTPEKLIAAYGDRDLEPSDADVIQRYHDEARAHVRMVIEVAVKRAVFAIRNRSPHEALRRGRYLPLFNIPDEHPLAIRARREWAPEYLDGEPTAETLEAWATDLEAAPLIAGPPEPPRAVVVAVEPPQPAILAPYYQRGGVTLYCGRAEDIVPRFTRRGFVLCDPPYSRRVHANAVSAGRRTTPLLDGNGRASPCATARKVVLGFDALTPEFRRFCAEQAARLAARWALFFCDGEGLGAWGADLDGVGIPYRTHCLWHKIGGSPKFQGNEAAIPDETIAFAGEDPIEAIETGGHIACAHRVPDAEDATPARWWNAGGKIGFYPVPRQNVAHGQAPRINATQKPEKLIEDLILDWTDPGELIYDWAAGGCTTGVVGARLGHPVILVEQREEQCESAAKRLDALFARPDVIEAGARERAALWLAAKRERARRAAERKEIREAAKRQRTIFDLPSVEAV